MAFGGGGGGHGCGEGLVGAGFAGGCEMGGKIGGGCESNSECDDAGVGSSERCNEH